METIKIVTGLKSRAEAAHLQEAQEMRETIYPGSGADIGKNFRWGAFSFYKLWCFENRRESAPIAQFYI